MASTITETPDVSVELLNRSFCDKVFCGQIKEAMENSSLYIRQKLYEDGILRRLFDSVTLTMDELDPELDSDNPSKIVEIEPEAPSATFVAFPGTGDREYFYGKRMRVPFGKIEATREAKSKFELMSIRMPITEWIKEHQVKMIQEEEDRLFLEAVEDVIAKNKAAQEIRVSMAGSDFKRAFTEGWKALTRLRLPQGKALMHKNTFIESLKLKTDDIGFNPQEQRFNRRLDGEDSFMGSPVVTTIKDNLVKENEIYFFTQQDFFIKFFFLQDATLFLKTEADMVYFHSYEAPGIGIGNTAGVVKVILE